MQPASSRLSVPRLLAGAHAAYLVGSGLWALTHRPSFERVTGPKRDYWLVRLVGALAALTGTALGVAVARGRRSPEARTLALGSAAVFAAADVYAARRSSRVYLGDVLAQAIFAPAWLLRWSSPSDPSGAGSVAPPAVRPASVERSSSSDDDVARRVRATVDLPMLDVEVADGIVTLHGVVESQELGDDLAEQVAQVRGVRGVDPHLQVG